MRNATVVLAAMLLPIVACDRGGDGIVHASDVIAYAPLPGSEAGVAYLTLHNDTDTPIVIATVSSRQFARAELHETRIENNISSMRSLPSVTIPAGGTSRFEPGGRHIMLRAARGSVTAGTTISLILHGPAGPVLEIATPLRERSPVPRSPAGR